MDCHKEPSQDHSYLNILKVALKWIIKIIFNKYYRFSSEKLFEESKLFTFQHLYFLSLANYHHQYKHMFPQIDNLYNTRLKEQSTLISKVEIIKNQKFLTYLSPIIYREIPNEIKHITNIFLFQKKVKLIFNFTKLLLKGTNSCLAIIYNLFYYLTYVFTSFIFINPLISIFYLFSSFYYFNHQLIYCNL